MARRGDFVRVAKGAAKVAQAFLNAEGPVAAQQALRLREHGVGLSYSLRDVSNEWVTVCTEAGALVHCTSWCCCDQLAIRLKCDSSAFGHRTYTTQRYTIRSFVISTCTTCVAARLSFALPSLLLRRPPIICSRRLSPPPLLQRHSSRNPPPVRQAKQMAPPLGRCLLSSTTTPAARETHRTRAAPPLPNLRTEPRSTRLPRLR